MCRPVEIVLTFDDGPHSGGQNNRTRKVIETLADNPTASGIRAIFFIQSHAQDANGQYFRGKHPNGEAVLEEALASGHLVQIHTGMDGFGAHLPQNYHPERLEANELVNDLDRCRAFIEGLDYGQPEDESHEVEFVRPPGGDYEDPGFNVLPTYTDEGLKMTLWDIDPQDWNNEGNVTPADVASRLYNGVFNAVRGGATELVILLHDVEPKYLSTCASKKLYSSNG